MSEKKIQKLKLASLHDSKKIAEVWNNAQNKPLIKHPQKGWISPNKFRSSYKNKPCPYCGKKMVQGQDEHCVLGREAALARGYDYKNKKGNLTFNQIGNTYFHQNYVTLDHKMNKARFPELMFDFSNLEVICWRCNNEKKDNNAFELEHNLEHAESLYQFAKEKYKKL